MPAPIVNLDSRTRAHKACCVRAEVGAVLCGVAETFDRYVLTCSASG